MTSSVAAQVAANEDIFLQWAPARTAAAGLEGVAR